VNPLKDLGLTVNDEFQYFEYRGMKRNMFVIATAEPQLGTVTGLDLKPKQGSAYTSSLEGCLEVRI
jgi:hypothetical protein